jgi:hypothetical protein
MLSFPIFIEMMGFRIFTGKFNNNKNLIIGLLVIGAIIYFILVGSIHNTMAYMVKYSKTEYLDDSGKVIKTKYYP